MMSRLNETTATLFNSIQYRSGVPLQCLDPEFSGERLRHSASDNEEEEEKRERDNMIWERRDFRRVC